MPNFLTQDDVLGVINSEQDSVQNNYLIQSGRYVHIPRFQRDNILAEINVYDGPEGKGYQINGETVIDNETWERVIHVVGLETWREQAWQLKKLNFTNGRE